MFLSNMGKQGTRVVVLVGVWGCGIGSKLDGNLLRLHLRITANMASNGYRDREEKGARGFWVGNARC